MAKAHWQNPGLGSIEIRSRGFGQPGFWRMREVVSGQEGMRLRRLFVIFCESVERLWRLMTKRLQKTPRKLFVSETATLGERRSIAVIEFEQRRFLIGCSAGSVNLLTQLPDAETKQTLTGKDSEQDGRTHNGRVNDTPMNGVRE